MATQRLSLSRRELITGAAALAAAASLPAFPAQATTVPPNGWPGLPLPPDTQNVGHLSHPSYPGSLTTYTGPSTISTSNGTYNFLDFVGTGLAVTGTGNVFNGCRFRSNWVDGWNVRLAAADAGTATQFKWCTFAPLNVAAPPDPAGPSWPSAGARQNVYGGAVSGGYMIPQADAYQYGILHVSGKMLVQDCDIWGFGNAVTLSGSAQKTIRRCWIHDASHEGSGAGMYHQDGPGHLDGFGCSNVLIEYCTIASLGNTNAIAFQAGTYSNITVHHNFLSGFGYCVDMCHGNAATTSNLTFEDNQIATDIGWFFGPLYTDFSASFSEAGCLWSGNKLRVAPGTVPRTGTWAYTASDHNKFIHPDGTLSTTDW